jgi:hypothetical protein
MSKLVENRGLVYRVSDRNYRKLLLAIASNPTNNNGSHLDQYGKFIGRLDIRVMTAKDAQCQLGGLLAQLAD